MPDAPTTAEQLGSLALQAMEALESYPEGRAVIGDAMLLVEVQLLDDEGDQIATSTHYYSTSRRTIVQRGLADSFTNGLNADSGVDPFDEDDDE